MSATSRVSPLPPDRRGGGPSPLPPDPAPPGRGPGQDQSPLPPGPGLDVPPLPRPRHAPDDAGRADGSDPGGEQPGRGPDSLR